MYQIFYTIYLYALHQKASKINDGDLDISFPGLSSSHGFLPTSSREANVGMNGVGFLLDQLSCRRSARAIFVESNQSSGGEALVLRAKAVKSIVTNYGGVVEDAIQDFQSISHGGSRGSNW